MKRIWLALAALLALIPAAAMGENVLYFSHALTEWAPYHHAFLEWAQAVRQRTDGELTIRVYADAGLGAEEDVLEQMRTGANIGYNTDFARLGSYVPELAVFNGPYMLGSLEQVAALRELPAFVRWSRELDEKFGLRILSVMYVQGWRNVICGKEIRTPQDLDGIRLRTPGAPIWQETVRAIGAMPVALPRADIVMAVHRGRTDGIEDVYSAYAYSGLSSSIPVVSETRHVYLINVSVCSSSWFDALPEEHQRILIEEADRAGMTVSREIETNAQDVRMRLEEQGVKVVPHEEIDTAAFIAASERAYKVMGIELARDEVLKELDEIGIK